MIQNCKIKYSVTFNIRDKCLVFSYSANNCTRAIFNMCLKYNIHSPDGVTHTETPAIPDICSLSP